jgi:asparagine N-glycosylation enzyme membrane subunit Stt3
MRIDATGHQINTPGSTTPPTLTVNGQLNITPTSNTNVRISFRGTDGVTRTANITLT